MTVPQSMATVFNVMLPAGDVLTSDSIEALRTIFGKRDIAEIGNMTPFAIATEIVVKKDSSGFPDGIQPADAALALLDCMRKLGVIAAPEQPVPTVKVELPKTLDQMTLSELLTELRDNPNRYAELVPHVEKLPAVRKASRRTTNWALRDAARKLDVKATVDNVAHLNKLASLVRKEVGGQRPTSLARICDQEERPMLNPFATNSSEMVVTGPFYGDFDLGNLSEGDHLAYLWARDNHPDWPKQIDLYEDVPAAFAEELSARWKKMVDDYKAAKEDSDPTTEGLSRYAPADVISGSRHPFESGESEVAPDRTEEWYREKLESLAGRGIRQTNASVRKGRAIVRSISTTNAKIILNDTIVLGDIITSNAKMEGRAYVLRNSVVRTTHAAMNLIVMDMNYEGLFNKAVEFGLTDDNGNSIEDSASSSEPRTSFQNNFYGAGTVNVVGGDQYNFGGNVQIGNFGGNATADTLGDLFD